MTEAEAKEYLQQVEGFDRFYIESAQSQIIYAGEHGTGRARIFKLEDGKLFEHAGYDFVSDIWKERELVFGKLEGVEE